ncbi:MAG: DoxX family protein [Microbacterium sp. SCN 70-200]|uniref:DoxX family protein n=1 Tax=unclassified Microbacterium TaxID=2609290 RepID=UPI00086DF389|nr:MULTISPECIES: DoxX family protein [unclassified Microbacterium]MBN9215668.1 DoxX family protein [Microbacterium sp.]ODT41283.1 MAG: DoxX family protein [Microbacterium sp. SCN 70-200]OJV81738.1 MAG: DoxX family protein [Microbacterium sp. 70-16]
MTIALWIVNILLALAFLAAGAMKAARPKEALAANGMAWTEDFSSPSIKLIGIAEVIGAVGLIVPLLTGIAPILTPIAAVCLAIIMIGATATHARRKESVAPGLVLAVLSIASAVLGFLVVLG